MSHQQSQKAAKKSKDIAKANAERIRAETAESQRRLGIQQARKRGQVAAMAAASGVLGDEEGTAKLMQDSMAREQALQLGWVGKAGASQAGIASAQGGLQAQQIMGKAYANWASVAGGIAGSMGGMTMPTTSAGKTNVDYKGKGMPSTTGD